MAPVVSPASGKEPIEGPTMRGVPAAYDPRGADAGKILIVYWIIPVVVVVLLVVVVVVLVVVVVVGFLSDGSQNSSTRSACRCDDSNWLVTKIGPVGNV